MTSPGGPPARASLTLGVVALGVFIAADDLMVVATMLRPMTNKVGMTLPDDLDASAWIVNTYLIAYIAAIPLAGKLSDLFGRRAVFIGGLAVFTVGSVVVPTTTSFSVLLLGRALSAIGGGALVPVALAVAGDLYKGAARRRALGALNAVETLGWVWGPLYGALLVRFLTWEWQFYLNVPLALIAMALGWKVLQPNQRAGRGIDWLGATLLTTGLIALNVALLGQAKIQTVSGLEELTGGSSNPLMGPWLFGVAGAAILWFVIVERRRSEPGRIDPVIAVRFLQDRRSAAALCVNGLVGAGLVIALVNVPLYINVVESRAGRGIGEAALLSGWLLTALTVSMAATSYLGGVAAGRHGNATPTLVGLVLASIGFLLIGGTWSPTMPRPAMAAELALVGIGIGLVLAPTSDAVVETGEEADRGAAAGLVVVFRLIGFSVGLASLTAWGLRRFNELRDNLELPPLGEPGFQDALADASVQVTTTALAETFLGAGFVLIVAFVIAGLAARRL